MRIQKMKKYIIFYFSLLSTFAIASHEDLKQAIMKSDATMVKLILTQKKFSRGEVTSFSKMAQNIVIRRHVNEKIAFLPEIIGGVPGLVLSLATVPAVLLSNALSFIICTKVEPSRNYYLLPRTIGTYAAMGAIGLSLVYGSYKLFRVTNKLHENAIEIQQLLDLQEAEMGNS